MAYTGKWKRTQFENETEILKYIGMPKTVADKMRSTEPILEIKRDGDTFDEVMSFGERVRKSVLTVGKTSKFRTWNDDRVDVVPVEEEPNKIKIEYDHAGIHYCFLRELLSDTQFTDTINVDHGKHIGRMVYTKC